MNSGWAISYSDYYLKQRTNLPHTIRDQIDNKLRWVLSTASTVGNPARFATKIQGYGSLWHYRVGKYRVICHIHDEQMEIDVIAVELRARAYKNKQKKRLEKELYAIERGEGSGYPE